MKPEYIREAFYHSGLSLEHVKVHVFFAIKMVVDFKRLQRSYIHANYQIYKINKYISNLILITQMFYIS